MPRMTYLKCVRAAAEYRKADDATCPGARRRPCGLLRDGITKSEPRAGRRRIQGGEAFSVGIQTGLVRLAQNRKKKPEQQNQFCASFSLHQVAPSSLRASRGFICVRDSS